MTILCWRVYSRPALVSAPSRFLGNVYSETKEGALRLAEARGKVEAKWEAKEYQLISQMAWDAMSPKEHAIFKGTWQPEPEPNTRPDIRESKCIECGTVILYARDGSGKWRNPPIRCHGPGCVPRRKIPLDTVTATPIL
jgi:hypothetical protein